VADKLAKNERADHAANRKQVLVTLGAKFHSEGWAQSSGSVT
jgi:hypothetical protein